MWALGCLAYELLSGQSPFADDDGPDSVEANILAARPDVASLRVSGMARTYIEARRRRPPPQPPPRGSASAWLFSRSCGDTPRQRVRRRRAASRRRASC